MDNLKNMSHDLENISETLKYLNLPMCNGVNTLNSHITNIKIAYDTKNFDILKNSNYLDLENLEKLISINFVDRIDYLINQDEFIDEWIILEPKEKKNIVLFDEKVYPLLRQKLNTHDFNFMFSSVNLDDFLLPNLLLQWCKISEGQKIAFFKIRKSAENTEYKEFFHLSQTLSAEKNQLNEKERKKIVIEYLNNKNKLSLDLSNTSWYNRVDMIKNNDYIYIFLRELEDNFNGYTKIKEKIELPSLLKTWVNLNIDLKAYEKSILEFEKSCVSLSNEELKKRNKEHPSNLLRLKIEAGITTDEFEKLKMQAKGSYMEDFFNSYITYNMRTEMPYKRQEYMFLYFRETFMNNIKNNLINKSNINNKVNKI